MKKIIVKGKRPNASPRWRRNRRGEILKENDREKKKGKEGFMVGWFEGETKGQSSLKRYLQTN